MEARVFLSEQKSAHFFVVPVTLAVLIGFVLSAAAAQAQGTFVSFDAPGAAQGTFPMAINRSGLIVGYFVDGSGVHHGFMRATDGTFTIVDVPGSTGTYVTTVNSKGLAAGYSYSPDDTGFLRYRDGSFATLLVEPTKWVEPVAMNDIGQIAGNAGLPIPRGFVWSHGRTIIWEMIIAGSWAGVYGMNSSGVIVGAYNDRLKQTTVHGFVRDSTGNISSFDATDSSTQTRGTAINAGGQIAGWYLDATEEALPFLRDADGTITLFSLGGAQGEATSINDAGVVVGNTINNIAPPYENAFERDAAGNVTLLALPFSNLASTAVGINFSGRVVGTYYDSAYVAHGWLMTP